jgi:hypothetical protein
MIRKSVKRFSETIMLKQYLKRDGSGPSRIGVTLVRGYGAGIDSRLEMLRPRMS